MTSRMICQCTGVGFYVSEGFPELYGGLAGDACDGKMRS